MEDRKIRIVNSIFLIFTIIYLLCSFIFFFDIYSEGVILGIGTRLYLIGFIVFVICNMHNKKNLGIKTFSILAIVSMVATIAEYISIISYNILYTYVNPAFIEILLIIIGSIQKILLAVLLIFNIKEKEKIGLAYALLVVTAILDIVMMFQNVTIEYCLLIVTNIYVAVYLLYFNKGTSIKSFRNIILIIITVFLIIALFILSVTWLPKVKYNNVVKKLQKIDSISSNISSITRNLKYNNNKKTFSYDISENVQERSNNGTISNYSYNNISIGILTQKLDTAQISTMYSDAENFSVNGRIFYIIPTTSYKGMVIYTNIENNTYCLIVITFNKSVSLSKNDLQNLKPFFYIHEK